MRLSSALALPKLLVLVELTAAQEALRNLRRVHQGPKQEGQEVSTRSAEHVGRKKGSTVLCVFFRAEEHCFRFGETILVLHCSAAGSQRRVPGSLQGPWAPRRLTSLVLALLRVCTLSKRGKLRSGHDAFAQILDCCASACMLKGSVF